MIENLIGTTWTRTRDGAEVVVTEDPHQGGGRDDRPLVVHRADLGVYIWLTPALLESGYTRRP